MENRKVSFPKVVSHFESPTDLPIDLWIGWLCRSANPIIDLSSNIAL